MKGFINRDDKGISTYFAITFSFQLSGQAVVTGVFLSPPGLNMPSFLSSREFSTPIARRFSSNLANSRSRAFREKKRHIKHFLRFIWAPAGIRTPALIRWIVAFEVNHYTIGGRLQPSTQDPEGGYFRLEFTPVTRVFLREWVLQE